MVSRGFAFRTIGLVWMIAIAFSPRVVDAQAASGGSATAVTAARANAWDGVYTQAQALRGAKAYSIYCEDCHGADLSGGVDAGPLTGKDFFDRFREAPLALLFDKVSATMPDDAPGSLDAKTYLDSITYVMAKNELPAGTEELTEARLGTVWLYNHSGPEALPEHALVAVSGCMTAGQGPRQWSLLRASTPVRVATPEPAAGKPAPILAGDAQTYQLDASRPGGPITWDDMAGQQVTVRGSLQGQGTAQRIAVTHVRSLRPACSSP
jgi:hypothetical protein